MDITLKMYSAETKRQTQKLYLPLLLVHDGLPPTEQEIAQCLPQTNSNIKRVEPLDRDYPIKGISPESQPGSHTINMYLEYRETGTEVEFGQAFNINKVKWANNIH